MANRSGTLWPSEHDMDSEIRVMLDNDSVWQEFHSIETEMLLTRKGRRMFPFCRYRLTGLAPRGLYFLVMDFQLLDEQRYRWTVEGRVPCGPSETHEARGRVYTHPSSPTTGSVWMEDPVVFRAVKLTSNLQNNDGLVVLHSNHRYIPRLHVVPFDPYGRNTVDLDSPETQTFVFPQTEFYAVSCYQNPRLIKLKIKHNPFASQFRHEEMQSDQLMQLPAGGAHESSVSLSPDSKHAKGNKWAKKRSSLPSSAEYGLGASPVFKKRMHLSERSLGNDSSRLSGGLNCTEEMFCTDDESQDGDGDDESTQWPLKGRPSAPSLKKQVPAKFKSRATASKVSARTFTSTPRVMKRPSLTSQKTPKMPPHRRKSTGSGKNARGSNAVTEAPSEPAEPLACELAVDDVEGMLFVSFSSKDSHDTHVPLKRQPPPLPPQPPLPPPPPSPPSKCPPVLQVQVATRATEPEEVTGEGPEVQQESIVQLQKVLLLDLGSIKHRQVIHPALQQEGPEVQQESIVQLQKVLLLDLGSIKHRQVIHPALQQVGLKLNLVDPEVAIDLQYLGVALPLPPFPQSCAEGTIPFVSRTGKTNDLTKIKGWRDKYSSSSDLPSGPPQERAVKVPSAFSSELLDEYLESEGQSISERAETFSSFSDPAAAAAAAGVAYSLPSTGSSYVRTLDSVLKSHAATASAIATTSTSARPTAATRSPTWPAGPGNAKPSPKPGPSSHQVPVHSLKHSPIPGGMSPGVSQSWGSRVHPGGKAPLKRDASLGVSRYTGFTVSQRHLQALEKHAFCRGHTDTYITTERATVALSVLLTAQGSVKADRVSWTTADVLGPCQRDCCRLGCVCLSLTREPRGPTHCRRPQCMFECACFRHRVLLMRPHPDSNTRNSTKTGAQGWRKQHVEKTADEDPKLLAYPISDADKSPRPSPGQRVRVLWEGRGSETDPEPLYRPERQRVDTDRTSVLSAALSKPASRSQPRGGGRRVDEVEKDSPVYMYFDSMMTCARVRPINSMPPPQMHILPFAMNDRAKEKAHHSPETSVGKLDAAPSQKSAQVAQKQVLETEAQPTKLLEIVSECNWEPHRNLVLSALNRRLKLNLLTPSFRLGFYRVRLLSTDRQKGLNHSTITYKLSISHIDNDSDDAAEKEKSQKKLKLQPPQPPKPGYLKAFKLRPSGSPNRLVEVNGKHYAKARLMLGRMGALHPANRLAAFVTGRMVTLPQTEAEERLRAAVRKTSEALGSSAASSQTQESSVRESAAVRKTSEALGSSATSSQTQESSMGERAAPEPLADAPPKEPCASQLLYIPIGSPDGVTPTAPSTLDPSGLVTHAQKVMLKPVGSTQKGALYRQPNGQLVQLVPLKPLQAIRPKPTPGSAPGIQSGFLTPSGPWPENSSSSQDGSTDPDTPPVTPDASAVVAKRFSLSGKSTMCISQGSAAVRTLPGVGAFSFRICPPSEQSKPQELDSQVLGEDQNPSQNMSSSLALPGGFTLIQLPKASDGEVKMSVGGAKTAAAAFPQATDKSYGTLSRKGSKIAGMSKLDTQITGTLAKERKTIVAPVVIPKTAAAAFPQATDKSYGTLSRKGSKIAGMSKLDTQITGTLVKERKTIVAPVVIPKTAAAAFPQATDKSYGTLSRKGSKIAGMSKLDTQITGTLVKERKTIVAPVVIPKTAAAAFPQATDKSYGTLSRKGSKIAGMSKLDTQITGTLVKERKTIVAPVVIPPMVLGTPKPSYISPRTIKQASETPQASNTSIRTSRQASETPQVSNISHRTSQQDSGTPQASNTPIRTSRQASETPQVSNISHRTSQQESGTSQASNTSIRTSRQASETPQVSNISHRTSQQDSGTPKANVAAVPPKATGTMHRGPEIQQSSERGTKVHPTPEPLNHIIKERQRRVVQENGFKRLKEVLRISNLKVTQQDILDQARLIIGALKTRERSLERRKAALRETQSVYIKTISDLSGKSEEQIRKKLQETSKRQRLLEQYRQRQSERNKPSQTQLTAKECDWLTERFAIWKRHKRKRKRKQLLEDQEEEATGVEPAVGTLKPSWRSDVKARDSPELRAALLTPGSNAAQVSSSSQLSSPSNSGAQGQQNIPSSGLDINKVLSLLKVKSLPPQYSHLGGPVKLLLVPVLTNVGKPDEKADAEAKDPAALTDTPSTADATETSSVHAGKVTFSPFSLKPGTTEGPSVCNGRDLKGNCQAVDSSDDHSSESLAEDAGNISPSGPVDASSSEHKNESRPKEVPTPGGGEVPGCNIEKPEEQPCSDVAIATEKAEHQCVDESVSAAEANMANVHAKQPAPTPTTLVENGVPKRKRGRPRKHPKAERGRPRKHPKADDPTPKTQPAPPPPPKTQSAAPPPKTQSAAPPPKTQSSSKHSPRLQARHLRSHLPVTTRTHTRRGKRRGRR
ncbi:uncharacterized protein LOC143109701 [Alosa pseudoharengus]|uniref:uncharacterized protein LOC143109701 n=1 Tax=Alosa pseudoharengus TaxID=34774 RepID=UPI003F8C1948